MLSNCGVGEDSWETLRQQGDQTSPSYRKSTLNIHWKDWCWSSNTLATWYEELTHWKRPWCWERLRAGGEGDDRSWDWVASSTRWTWMWASSRSWWWTEKPGVVQSMGSQRVGCGWATELTELNLDPSLRICLLDDIKYLWMPTSHYSQYWNRAIVIMLQARTLTQTDIKCAPDLCQCPTT